MKFSEKILNIIKYIIILLMLTVVICNVLTIALSASHIKEEDFPKDIDCIIVLGCGLVDGSPSLMLEDRLNRAIELYRLGAAPKILMSGDHRNEYYDEVTAMKNYAVAKGVPKEDIFLDHAGLSTYESIYRVKEIFKAKKIIVVTQKYHLYRALYIARAFNIEAYGACAEEIRYFGQFSREVREVLARTKDYFACIFKPEPTFLGDPIDIKGDGTVTY